MVKDIRTDYFIAGAGILLASRLAASGKRVVLADQGPRFSEIDRSRMLRRSRETLNDFADDNDGVGRVVVPPPPTHLRPVPGHPPLGTAGDVRRRRRRLPLHPAATDLTRGRALSARE